MPELRPSIKPHPTVRHSEWEETTDLNSVPRAFLHGISFLLVANIINIGAAIGAMGAALNLLIGGAALLYCVLFALVSVFASPDPVEDLFKHFEMVNVFLVLLRRHNICGSDRLG